MTKLKANHELLLPDGKTKIEAGKIFEYEGDYSSFASVVSVIAENKKEKAQYPVQDTEEKIIREKARLMGIKNYYNKGLKKLKDEISEKEAAVEKGAPNTPDADPSPAPVPETAPADTPAHVENDPETSEEGKYNV